MDSVGFNKQGTVTQSKAKPNTKATDDTDPWRGFCNKEERKKITEHDTTQKYYSKFSTRCFDELVLVINYEDYGHSSGCYDTRASKN